MMKIIVVLIICSIVHYTGAVCLTDTTILGNDTIVICTTKTEDGKLISVERFKNGKNDGIFQEWYKNGNIQYQQKFINGCPQDTAFAYHEDGSLSGIFPYLNCVREGQRVELSVNGDTLAMGNAKNGKSIGTHYAWYENKKKRFITNYNDSGQKHGLSLQWREDGTLKDSIVYRNGEMIEARFYYDNGKPHSYLRINGNDKYFSGIYYNPKGEKTGETKNGNGTYIYYNYDGSSPVKYVRVNNEYSSQERLDPVTLKVIDPDNTPEAIKKRVADSIGVKAIEAIESDNIDSIKSLLNSGFDVNTVFRDPKYFRCNVTMLHLTALLNKKNIAEFLLRSGADPRILESDHRYIAAEIAYDKEYDYDFVILLLDRDSTARLSNAPFGSPGMIVRALCKDDLKMLKYLLGKGFDPYSTDYDDMDIFQIAAANGSLNCIKYLFTIYKKPDYKNQTGYSLFHWAACAKKNGIEIMNLFIENGYSPSVVCEKRGMHKETAYETAMKLADMNNTNFDAPKRESYLKTAAYIKELEKRYCAGK